MIHKLASSFNAGELSSLMDSRAAVEKYESGCRKLRNFILHTHGPVYRRPGMEYLGPQKNDDVASRFVEFNFSTDTSFLIEMAQGVFRFWDGGKLVRNVDGTPYSVWHPYSPGEFFEVQVKQINDVLYMTHRNHWPHKLSRLGTANWRSETMPWTYPPLLDEGIGIKSVEEKNDPAEGVNVYEWPLNVVHNGLKTRKIKDGEDIVLYVTGMNDGLAKKVNAHVGLQVEKSPGDWDTVNVWSARSGVFQNNATYRDNGPPDLPHRFLYWEEEDEGTGSIPGKVGIRILAGADEDEVTDKVTMHVTEEDGDTFLTCSKDFFKNNWAGDEPGSHKDAYFQIVHRREDVSDWLVLSNVEGGTDPDLDDIDEQETNGIFVRGRWDLYTYGRWKGLLQLKQRERGGSWKTIRSWTSNYDRNVVSTGETDDDVELMLVVTAISRAADTADMPARFLLEAADARAYGLVRITEVVSKTVCKVKVVHRVECVYNEDDYDSEEKAEYAMEQALTDNWTEGAFSSYRGFPAALGLYEQRIWFGGTKKNPQSLWGSVSGDFENFRRTTKDDGGIFRTLAADAANSIRWISSASALLVGTGAEVWSIAGAGGGEAPITPVNMNAVRQSGYSSNSVPARLAHEVTLFVQRDGRRLRQLSYTQSQEGYTAADLTVLAPHVTAGGIRQLTFQQAPTAIVWAVTNEGRLIGMTFEREQNVFGWHVHSTFSRAEDDPLFDPEDGRIETVAVLHGTPSDEVYIGVKRKVAGVYRRHVERLSGRMMAGEFQDRTRLSFSDCHSYFNYQTNQYEADGTVKLLPNGSRMPGPMPAAVVDSIDQPVGKRSVITGLAHLEGRRVVILADGVAEVPKVVTGGKITLQSPASVVVVGLPYESVLQPMKQEINLDDGTAQGRRFKLNGVTVRLIDSQGGEVSANPADPTLRWEPIRKRDITIPLEAAPPLFTGERDIILESRHEGAVNLTVRTSEPLPLNLTALIMKYDVYGV